MYFSKRLPEPKVMEKGEFDVFEGLSRESYRRWIVPLVDDALEKSMLKAGAILDVGCGPGLLAKEFAKRSENFQVIGLDISPYALQLAKKNCKGIQNIKFVEGNVAHLPFKNGLFDLVVCKDSMHHFGNIKRSLKEMVRITKSGGFVYIQDLRRDLPSYLLMRSMPPDTILKKLQFYSVRASYTPGELKQIFRSFKFKRYTIKTRRITSNLRKKYQGKINLTLLKEAFQARYIAIIQMNR